MRDSAGFFLPTGVLELAAAGLLVAAVVMLAVLLVKLSAANRRQNALQAQTEETLANYFEQMLREAEGRQVSREQHSQTVALDRLRESDQNDSQRIDALGLRLDRLGSVQDERLRHIAGVLNERLTANDEKVERMRDTLFSTMSRMQADSAAKLEEMRKTVDENLHNTLNKRLGESFSLVNERLEQVYKGLGEMQSLAHGVGDLKRVLTNIKTRGIWGEVQLGAMLDDMLTKQQYIENAAVKPGTQERVEYAIRLPGRREDGDVLLPIDAKFPVDPYERLVSAMDEGDKALVDAARTALAAAIRKEAARIRDKYIAPPYTTDFAILYLPTEGLYAEALRTGGLAESLQRDMRVVLSGPTTLAALINSLQMGFRTLAIEQRSGEVWQLLGAGKAEFASFADLLAKTQQRLRQASDSIESAARKTRTIRSKLNAVELLDAPAYSLPDEAGEEPMDDQEGETDSE